MLRMNEVKKDEENDNSMLEPSSECGELRDKSPNNEIISITGIAGTWPKSKNIYDLRDNLYNKIDMVTAGENHWANNYPEIPSRSGKMQDIEKFDAGFFGVHCRQAHAMDPAVRIMLEKSVEAIIDAGYNPSEFEGSNTGVFMISTIAETEMSSYRTNLPADGQIITGCSRTAVPNRVSYYLKLKGPSHCIDTACSSSVTAIEHGYRAIKKGVCDRAIVGGYNTLLHPSMSLQYNRLGLLSQDGSCKSFDNKANGFVRSEGVGVVILQKSKEARRIYANVVHAKTSYDGFKIEGITFPSCKMQSQLLKEIYFEANVSAEDLSYMEAHGPGTVAGDSQELNAIDQALCQNRTKPLLIGSTKSNLGHCETGSGLVSITKVIIMMENEKIPANLHFTHPRKDVDGLHQGRLSVVTECIPLPKTDKDCLVGVSNFGYGGSNAHVILQWNKKAKTTNLSLLDDLSRVVCVSGRTEESVRSVLDDIKNRPLDLEYIRLYHQVFSKNIEGHLYRGYSIVGRSGEVRRSISYYSQEKKPLFVILTIFGDSWYTIAKKLRKLPLFSASLKRVNNILITKKHDAVNLEESEELKKVDDNDLYEIWGNMTVQIAIIDLFKTLDLNPSEIVGVGLGEFACCYYKEVLTLEETIDCIYVCHTKTHDFCYFVAMSSEKEMPQIPPGINAFQINKNCAILTGNTEKLKAFAEILIATGGLVKMVNYNSNTEQQSRNIILKILKKLRMRSSKRFLNDTEEYYIPHKKLLKDAEILAIGNNELTLFPQNAQLKVKLIKLENLEDLLETLGSLFKIGYHCDLAKLYPDIQYPVSRSTPMISPLIKWDHSKNWHVLKYKRESETTTSIGVKTVSIDINDKQWSYLSGHVVDGHNFFPATGYLYIVWEFFAEQLKLPISKMQIVFENFKFHKATLVSKDRKLELSITLLRGKGCFEISEGETLVATGRIYVPKTLNQIHLQTSSEEAKPSLTAKDIYKEFRIRDYNYSGEFRKVQKCTLDASHGVVTWKKNWVTFLDNMLQLKLVQVDTRLLNVVTCINRISIDSDKHLKYIESLDDKTNLGVFICKHCDVIKCGGVEIQGMKFASIPKRGQRIEPLVLKHQFVPNICRLNTEDAIRVSIQVALENVPRIRIKVIELIEKIDASGFGSLAPIVQKILLETHLIQPEITVVTKLKLNFPNIDVKNKELETETDCYLVIGSNILERSKILTKALGATANYGYILTRESASFQSENTSGLEFMTSISTGKETLVLIKKQPITSFQTPTLLEINDYTKLDWLEKLQNLRQNNESVIVYANQNQSVSGVLGFLNALRKESADRNSVRCLFIDDDAPLLNLSEPFYADQLRKGFAINVYKNSQWGTYRHVSLEHLDTVEVEHCYVNTITSSNLSSLKWIEGPLTRDTITKSGAELIYVYFSALNFKDIMLSTGRIQADQANIYSSRVEQQCALGFEFAGRTLSGQRVMGIAKYGGLSNMVVTNKMWLWPIPENWTMEEAVTVPVVYATLIYAMFMRTKIRRRDSIFITSGCGAVGQAAITLALHFGCTIYTTVGTIEKREFLKKHFPQIKNEHIGNSRNTSFEQMIHQETNGRGVDFVINSLAEEKLQASVRCLAQGGKFLEIGRFDLINDNQLQLLLLSKEASFHGIELDHLLANDESLPMLNTIIMKLIRDGAILPIIKTVFETNCIEDAFRFMTSGKHIGKVVIKIRNEEEEKLMVPAPHLMKGVPSYVCDPSKTSIIIGGLGGMGLELADWLVLRGAKNIVLTSRVGVRNTYQTYRINIWKSYGVKILISTANIATRTGCEALIEEANQLGLVESIFNLAIELHDALLENQTKVTFQKVLSSKAIASQYLDEVTRRLCPNLRNFVMFSSVASGIGISGQTNYAMANSVMERICERRKENGYPALAIQWGAIGDVGVVAETIENEQIIGGILPQRIASCMKLMDTFLKQSHPVVLSMVVATERESNVTNVNLVETVAKILGLVNLKTISIYSSLTELGLDSIATVELKQILEMEFNIFLTSYEIRSLTLKKLQELQRTLVPKDKPFTRKELEHKTLINIRINDIKPTFPTVVLQSNMDSTCNVVVLFPDVDGVATSFEPLFINMHIQVVCLQYCYDVDSIEELAENLLPHVEVLISKKRPFKFVSYSYGTLVALEIVNMLEQKGYLGNLICVDSGTEETRIHIDHQFPIDYEAQFQTDSLIRIAKIFNIQDISSLEGNLRICKTFDQKLDLIEQLLNTNSGQSSEEWRKIILTLYNRLLTSQNYNPTFRVKSNVILYKAAISAQQQFLSNYGLSKLCANPVEVKSFEGNHHNLLQSMEFIQKINNVV